MGTRDVVATKVARKQIKVRAAPGAHHFKNLMAGKARGRQGNVSNPIIEISKTK